MARSEGNDIVGWQREDGPVIVETVL